MKTNICFIGAGAMAESLIQGWLRSKTVHPSQIIVTNQSNNERLAQLKAEYHVRTTRNIDAFFSVEPTILILACKPHNWLDAFTPFIPYLNKRTTILSVMAGVTTKSIEEAMKRKLPVIRTITNTSASVCESMTAISFGRHVNDVTKKEINELLLGVGDTAIVNEEQMDAMTALVGTGPAYIYYLMEAMEIAAEKMGIDYPLAKQLVAQTLRGASTRIQQTDKHPAELYKQVMSPGGTTEAGFKVLEDRQVQDALISCILRAWERSVELGNSYAKNIT